MSSKCCSASARSILAMMNGCLPVALAAGAHGLNIRALSTNDWPTAIHSYPEREFQAGAVVVGERTDTEVDARKIEPLPGAQLASDGDLALDVVAGYALDHQLHQTVVEEEPDRPASPPSAAARSSSRTRCCWLPDSVFAVSVKLSPGATESAPARILPTRILGPAGRP